MSDLLARFQSALPDRYIVERELGRGGMATVFLAHDVKQDRKVAIKLLHSDLAAAIGADRFRREIQIATRLTHPNILPLYDSGEAAGSLFYVMPFVDGESLRARLEREQQLPLGEAVRITCEVASALDYAHRHGFIHRDIKPENILIEDGHAVVADFGIARAMASADDKLTQTGLTLGTPTYMSPEQAVGERHIDGRSDLYSLACVLYEMLAGQPPFVGSNARAIIARHTLDDVPSLSSVRGTIPEEIEDAVMRALSKVPADRFATVAEFASALTTADLGPVRRTTRRTIARRHRAWRSRPALLSLAVVPLFAAGAGYGAWRLWGRPIQSSGAGALESTLDPRRVAVMYFEDLSRDNRLDYLASGLTESLIDRLDHVKSLEVASKNAVSGFGEDVPRDSIARALKVGTIVEGSVEPVGDRVRVVLRLVDGGSGAEFRRTSFERPARDLIAIRESLADDVAAFLRLRLGEEIQLREQLAGTRNFEAWAFVQRAELTKREAERLVAAGDRDGAGRAFERADSLLAAAEEIDAKWVEPAVLRSGIAHRRVRLAMPERQRADSIITIGLAHVERALTRAAKDPPALEMRGSLRYARWRLQLSRDQTEADQLLREAEQDLRAAVTLKPSQASAWSTLSQLAFQKHDPVEAKLAARRAYEEDAYLANTAEIIQRLFAASYELEQFLEAEQWCETGRQRFSGDPRFTQCRIWMLVSRAKPPNVDRAWELFGELESQTPAEQWKLAGLSYQLLVAAVIARAGLTDSARRVIERSRATPEVDPTRQLAAIEAYVHVVLKDHDRAIRLLKEYLTANPGHVTQLSDLGWWWRDLRDDPRFQEMIASAKQVR